MHDEAQRNIQIVQQPAFPNRNPLDGENAEYVPVNIQFDTSRFPTSNIESTVLGEVKDFMGKFLKCKKQAPFTLVGKYLNGNPITGTLDEGTNLYISLENSNSESIDEGLQASVVPVILQQNSDGRPIQGHLQVPIINYYQRDFQVNLIKHAVFHILGISASMYHSFKNPVTGGDYTEPIFCNFTHLDKNFTFLVTPGAHMVAANHFGPKNFVGDDGKECPTGIELDSNPAYGFSHPESLIYHTDIMTAATYNSEIQIGRVTDVTIAMLNDTGFYQVDFKLGQPNLWLNTYSYDTKNHTNWAIDSPENKINPELAFPSNYFADVNQTAVEELRATMGSSNRGPDAPTSVTTDYQVGFDFTYAGTISVLPFNYTLDLSMFNETGEQTVYLTDKVYYFKDGNTNHPYYNPIPRYYMGVYQEMKYMPLLLKQISGANPTINCPKDTFVHPGTDKYYSDKTYHCNKVTCDFVKYTNYTYQLDEQHSFTCTSAFQEVLINDVITIKCVDPGRYCRTINLTDSYFKGNPLLKSYTIDESASNASIEKKLIIGLVVTFLIIVIVAVIAFVFIFRWIKKKQREEDMRRFKAIIAKVKAKKRSQTVAESGGSKEAKEPLHQQKPERASRATSMIPRNPMDEPGQRGNLTPGQSGKTNERLQQILFLQQMDKTRDYQKVDDQKQQEQPPVAEMISHGPEPGENLDDISEGTSVDNPSSENEEKGKNEEDEAKPTDFDDALIL